MRLSLQKVFTAGINANQPILVTTDGVDRYWPMRYARKMSEGTEAVCIQYIAQSNDALQLVDVGAVDDR